MTPEIEKKRRELFGKWCDEQGYGRAAARRMRWPAFNGALDSVEIAFPSQLDEKYQDYYDEVEGGCFNCNRYLNDVRNAIEATGLGLRIK